MRSSDIKETKRFNINNETYIVCRWIKTRYGFKHDATFYKDWRCLGTTKACYYNRTWESYEYQSVIKDALHKFSGYTKEEQDVIDKKFSGENTEALNRQFGMIGAIAKLGEILCETPKEKNDWKARMLKAGLPGLETPPDWDTLSEEEKETRLNKVIEFAKKPV